jgi:hypothetical protein
VSFTFDSLGVEPPHIFSNRAPTFVNPAPPKLIVDQKIGSRQCHEHEIRYVRVIACCFSIQLRHKLNSNWRNVPMLKSMVSGEQRRRILCPFDFSYIIWQLFEPSALGVHDIKTAVYEPFLFYVVTMTKCT